MVGSYRNPNYLSIMNLDEFKVIVDREPPRIAQCNGNLSRLYEYVGLASSSMQTRAAVSRELHSQIQGSFSSGHTLVSQMCASLRTDLIRQHIFSSFPIDPYFDILDRLQDAIGATDDSHDQIIGDWGNAIRLAYDYVELDPWHRKDREKRYARDYNVARSAFTLRKLGYTIQVKPGLLSLESNSEKAVIATIERVICSMGGINVAQRIFKALSASYDTDQQRYHLNLRPSIIGEWIPHMPWGYLIQLAVKHVSSQSNSANSDENWDLLCALSQAYASVLDVQPYQPSFWGKMNAVDLLSYLQEMAVYDTLFRIPQMRPTDVARIAAGIFYWLDMETILIKGCSLDDVLKIINHILNTHSDVRGPIFFNMREIEREFPEIPKRIIKKILREVLSHSPRGVNQQFSHPLDAPIPQDPDLKDRGHDFFLYPLLQISAKEFVLLDRSVCAPACLEAMLTSLRRENKELDDKIGGAMEHFIKQELISRGVTISSGEYNIDGVHGECDVVIDATETVLFAEVKKKALTRRAKAGADLFLLMDLADSFLASQKQAGRHEVQLRRQGYLDLQFGDPTQVHRIELKNRGIERITISLFDFGSFQDRVLIQRFLVATMNATFTDATSEYDNKFKSLNLHLADIHDQVNEIYSNPSDVNHPFFNCWYLSLPQVLILLDHVASSDDFRNALWKVRHLSTGSSDFYYELSYVRKLHEDTNQVRE